MTSINYFCYLCGYDCLFNNSLEEHYKALNITNATQKEKYISLFDYKCRLCNFYCNVASSYRNHLISNSHKSATSEPSFEDERASRVANTSGG